MCTGMQIGYSHWALRKQEVGCELGASEVSTMWQMAMIPQLLLAPPHTHTSPPHSAPRCCEGPRVSSKRGRGRRMRFYPPDLICQQFSVARVVWWLEGVPGYLVQDRRQTSQDWEIHPFSFCRFHLQSNFQSPLAV